MSASTLTRDFFNTATAKTMSYFEMFKVIAALLTLGAIIAAVPLITGLVTASLANVITLYAATLAVVVAGAFFNYCFAAQFTQVSLSAKPIEDHKSYSNKLHINLRKTVSTLIHHANKKPGVTQLPTDILIANFRDDHSIKSTSVNGINPFASAIFIPSGVLLSHPQKLTTAEINALLMFEVIHIRNAHTRRGFVNILGNMTLAFLTLLHDLDRSPFLAVRLLGVIAGPLKFVELILASLARTQKYEAMEHLIQECGVEYGKNFKSAFNKLGLPWEITDNCVEEAQPDNTQEAEPAAKPLKRNFFQRVHKNVAEWILQVAKDLKEAKSDNPAANKTIKFLDEKLAKYSAVETPVALAKLNTPTHVHAHAKPAATVTAQPATVTNLPVNAQTAANDVSAQPQKRRRWF